MCMSIGTMYHQLQESSGMDTYKVSQYFKIGR